MITLGVNVRKYENRKIYYIDPSGELSYKRPKWSRTYDCWMLPANYDTLELFSKITKHPDIEHDYKTYKQQYLTMIKYKDKAFHVNKEFVNKLNIPHELNWLYDYQKVDAFISAKRRSFANLNTMRSGKTPTTCAALHIRYTNGWRGKVIISIMQATERQWKDELAKSCPEFSVLSIVRSGTPKKRKEAWNAFLNGNDMQVLLVNREKIMKDISVERKQEKMVAWNDIRKTRYGLITDEAHFLRNRKSQVSTAHCFLSEHADWRLALTGTKIANKGSDIYGLMKYLYPLDYTSYWDFVARFFIEETKNFGTTTIHEFINYYQPNQRELDRMVFTSSIERTKTEILNYLPKYERRQVYLELDEADHKKYNQLLDTFEYDDDDAFISFSSYVGLRVKLLQMSSLPKSVIPSATYGTKVKWMLNWLNENPDAKPLVFGRFTNSTLAPLVEQLRKGGFRVGVIDGHTKDKSQVAYNWQHGEYDVLVANIVAGGTGLTLDYADTTIMFERDDNYANNVQALERMTATNKGDQRPKEIIELITLGTLETIQVAQQEKKSEWAASMFPDEVFKRLWALELRFNKQR